MTTVTMGGVVNRVVLGLLEQRHSGLDDSLLGLAVPGRRSGRAYRFPVQYVESDGSLLVVPGRSERKTWWRNLREGPTDVEVLLHGEWLPARGELVLRDDPRHPALVESYVARFPKADIAGDPVVCLRPEPTAVAS